MCKSIITKIKEYFSDKCEFSESCKYYMRGNEACERQLSGDMVPCGTRRGFYEKQ